MSGEEPAFESRRIRSDQQIDPLAAREPAMTMLTIDPLGTTAQASLAASLETAAPSAPSPFMNGLSNDLEIVKHQAKTYGFPTFSPHRES